MAVEGSGPGAVTTLDEVVDSYRSRGRLMVNGGRADASERAVRHIQSLAKRALDGADETRTGPPTAAARLLGKIV